MSFILSYLRRALRDQRGTLSAEMALVTLIVSGLLFGVVEVARYGLLRYYLDLATYHAARYLSLNPGAEDTARALVRAQVERNIWGGIGEVELYVKSARKDGHCLLVLESRVHYESPALGWLMKDPAVDSAQVWPQGEGCGEDVASPMLPTPTPTPPPTATAKPVTPILLDTTEGVAMVNANIRLGPGFEYAIVGRLSEKEVVQVRGRDVTGTWLQIVPERVGWVYAPLVQLDVSVSSLRIVTSPPIPQRTSVPLPRLGFEGFPRRLKVGECAQLKWNAAGASFVTINETNVEVYGEQKVCPTQNTTYVLSAGFDHDRFYDREVKITVDPESDP